MQIIKAIIRNKVHRTMGQLNDNDTAIVVANDTTASKTDTNSTNLPDYKPVEGEGLFRSITLFKSVLSFTFVIILTRKRNTAGTQDESMQRFL